MALLSRLLITANRCRVQRIVAAKRNISASCHCLKDADTNKKTHVEKPKLRSEEVWRLLSLAKPEKYNLGGICHTFIHSMLKVDLVLFSGGIGMLFLSSGVTMAIPFSLGKIIDIIFNDRPDEMIQNLTNFSMLLGGIFALGAALNFGRTYLMGVSSIIIEKM